MFDLVSEKSFQLIRECTKNCFIKKEICNFTKKHLRFPAVTDFILIYSAVSLGPLLSVNFNFRESPGPKNSISTDLP